MPISDNECDDYDMDYKEYGSGLGGGGLDMGGDLGGDMVGDLGANGLPMSKAEQRRSNKPIMEKRRRARINHCLNELKSLILDAMKKDPARHSKLEKADILEMTVKHLQNVQRQQVSQAVTTDPHTLHKFKAGFNECASEVSRYVSRMDGLDAAVRQRLVAHLSGCVQGLQQIAPFSFPGLGQGLGQGLAHAGPVSSPAPSVLQQVHLSGDINNNNNNVSSRVQSLQLIPSRLPTGELALLLPNSGQLSTASLLFPAPATPAASATADTIIKASPLSPRSPHPSAFTAVGNLSALGSVAATPPSSDAASASASASGSASSSPDTPPSSARALQLARVAADSSTSSSPESTSSPCLPSQVHVRPHGRTSPTSSSVEIKLEPKLEPFDGDSTPRASGMHELRGLRGPGAIDFSLKRCASDGSETEADAEGEAAPPCKVPRYMLGVTSAPATSTGLGGHYLPPVAPPGPVRPALASPAVPSVVSPPAARAGHAQPQGDDKADRDMWRPW